MRKSDAINFVCGGEGDAEIKKILNNVGKFLKIPESILKKILEELRVNFAEI